MNVVVPLPAICEIEVAVISRVVTLATWLMVKAPSGVVAPADLLKVILPEPALNVRAPGPLTVSEKRIFPFPAFSVVAPVKVRALPNWIG